MRVLLEHGADPNARDRGDNAYPLHFAAAQGHLETVRALLDAGGDVHGFGDAHNGDVIGWAVGSGSNVPRDMLALLIERGAHHHIFSAIALGDMDLVRALVKQSPDALSRRRSRYEQGQTALHFALAAPEGLARKPPQYDMADLLIELGADVEATDDHGRTPLEIAMLHGDLEAMRRLKATGAKEPQDVDRSTIGGSMAALGDSIRKHIPMFAVPDMAATIAWYTSMGFTLQGRHPEQGEMDWACLSYGGSEIMLVPGRGRTSLWFYTDRIDALYEFVRARQLEAARAALAGEVEPGVRFDEALYEPFYGGRQFSVRDLNGLELIFTSG
ncbi:MAG: ankyrin repeat domain-containing protein [Gemmatimonadales bacterium]